MTEEGIDGAPAATGSRRRARRFTDEAGRWWLVIWKPRHNRSTKLTECFVFQAEDGASTRYLVGAPGDGAARLARMSLGDLRQLLCMSDVPDVAEDKG